MTAYDYSKAAQPSFEDQIASYAEKIGCDPILNDPQTTQSHVYQCAKVVHDYYGELLAYRKHKAGQTDRDHFWMPISPGRALPPQCVLSLKALDESWHEAVSDFENAQRVKRWRGDDKAADYYAPPWNIQGLLQNNAIAWIYGPPGSYKSVLAMGMACCVATGMDWCGRKTRQGPVLYISAEGGGGVYAMREAWEKANKTLAPHMVIHTGSPQIADVKLHGGVDEDGYQTSAHPIVRQLHEFKQILDKPASLIVIDTYSQTSPDDTKAAVTAYERQLRKIIDVAANGASVVVIDHTTKEGSSWMGSNAKLGNMDMMAMLRRKGDDVVLTMRDGRGKIKNAPAFDDIRLKASLVGVGQNDFYGNEIMAPILSHCPASFSSREKLLIEMIGDGISYADLREAWHSHEQMAEIGSGARKVALTRTIRSLRDRDIIAVTGVEYADSPDGPKERPMSDDCVLELM